MFNEATYWLADTQVWLIFPLLKMYESCVFNISVVFLMVVIYFSVFKRAIFIPVQAVHSRGYCFHYVMSVPDMLCQQRSRHMTTHGLWLSSSMCLSYIIFAQVLYFYV